MNNLKEILRLLFPALYSIAKKMYYAGNRVLLNRSRHEIVFNAIYRKNAWGDKETHSGAGSNTANTSVIRRELPSLVKRLDVHTLFDIPCGDFFWMKDINLEIEHYLGADIVKGLISMNRKRFESPRRVFIVLDLLSDDLPKADLILCRDCLPHFSFDDIRIALRVVRKSGSRYFLTSTYPSRIENRDIATGGFRPLNLLIPPFNFPDPLLTVNEQCEYGNGIYRDKGLSLWELRDLPA